MQIYGSAKERKRNSSRFPEIFHLIECFHIIFYYVDNVLFNYVTQIYGKGQKRKRIPLIFFLYGEFNYFCPVNPREIGVNRESAFFALFLVGELAHSLAKRGILKDGSFHCCVCVPLRYYSINSGAKPLFIIFLFRECKPYQRK